MIQIRPIASGSSGNCYFVSDTQTRLLLDCGIPVKRIQKVLWDWGYGLAGIDGCLITHEHGDHVKSAQKLADMGVDVYASTGTIEAAGLHGHRIHSIGNAFGEAAPAVKIGGTVVYGFDVEHDARQPFGFYIKTGRDVLVYVTDTAYIKYRLKRVTHLMIETNYDPDIIEANVESGRIDQARAIRTIGSHMSIDTVLLTLKKMDMARLKQVWLLHLSNDNAAGDFKRRVQEVAGCEVYVV